MNIQASMAMEIDRSKVLEGGEVSVRDRNGNVKVRSAGQEMRPGDFYFVRRIEERTVGSDEPKRRVSNPWYNALNAAALFGWVKWWLFAEKRHVAEVEVERVIISCPYDGLPIMTQDWHRIAKRRPLTIEGIIGCPYAAPSADKHAFAIVEGEIKMAAPQE